MTSDSLFDRLARALTGRYTLVRELGHGGMATVYLATDLKLGRRVAIKVLPPETREYLGADRFRREIQLEAQLSHPHIVPLFEADEADGLLYYVMEYVEGESLADRLSREGPLPQEEALRITAEVGDALQYAHERGILHRDVKPENILLSGGHALVADFGIAKVVAGSTPGESLTASGVSVGTVRYMSPEQASGGHVDGRTDVYALAAVLYEMLAGEPPFTGPTAQAVLARVLADRPRPLQTVRPEIEPHIERAVRAGLAKLAAERPASARAFVDLLRPPAKRESRTGPWLRGMALSGIVIAALAAALWTVTRRRSRARTAQPPTGAVLVPGGRYVVGGEDGRGVARAALDSFYIDSTEVTVSAYERFVQAGGAPTPWRARPPESWPVTGVLWAEAQAFCRWRDSTARLPTEAEWEAAARGPEARRYPWGNDWLLGRANAARATDTLAPVGAFPLGRSWVGAVDLVGNAWEWTATSGAGPQGETRHVIKGGAFNTPPPNAAASYRAALPDQRSAVFNTGFRCVRSLAR